jgi:hypothetical protein
VARAKRTNRADARRRYRAVVAETDAIESEDADESDDLAPEGHPAGKSAAPSSRRPQPRAAGSQAAQPARPGFTSALRAAARPFDLRSDIAYIPHLVLHTPAVWVPALATIASGAYFLIDPSNGIAVFLLQLFVVPPTIAGAFLGGVLAPRATYIAGGIAAAIGVMMFAIVVLTVPADSLALQPTPTSSAGPSAVGSATATVAPATAGESVGPTASASLEPSPSGGTSRTPGIPIDRNAAIVQSILVSVPFGVVIGAAGGYYRRFLRLSNQGARRREEQRTRQPRGPARRR